MKNVSCRDRRREYLNKNAWRGLAAIGIAVVLTMGECVSGIQLGIGKLGENGMLTSYADELWIPVSVTAETAQAAENARRRFEGARSATKRAQIGDLCRCTQRLLKEGDGR